MSDPYSDYTKLTGVHNRLKEVHEALDGVTLRSNEAGPRNSGGEDPHKLVGEALRRVEEELEATESSMEL